MPDTSIVDFAVLSQVRSYAGQMSPVLDLFQLEIAVLPRSVPRLKVILSVFVALRSESLLLTLDPFTLGVLLPFQSFIVLKPLCLPWTDSV